MGKFFVEGSFFSAKEVITFIEGDVSITGSILNLEQTVLNSVFGAEYFSKQYNRARFSVRDTYRAMESLFKK